MDTALNTRHTTIDDLLKHLFKSKTNASYLKQCLTPEVAENLKKLSTVSGGSLKQVIVTGVINDDSVFGVYAPDAHAYTVFSSLFIPIIQRINNLQHDRDIQQPPKDFSALPAVSIDTESAYILSTRIRLARNLQSQPFPTALSQQGYIDIENQLKQVLPLLPDDLKGSYKSMADMTQAEQDHLMNDHMLFNNHDRYLSVAGCYDSWPTGRGVFVSEGKDFAVWCNEEDHMRIMAVTQGAAVKAAYDIIARGEHALSEQLAFARDEQLGYLTSCPTNLGTTLRASVLIKLKHTSKLKYFKQLCGDLQLAVRGYHGEHSEPKDDIYDISNRRRLGLSEKEAVMEMVAGVTVLIEIEKQLENQQK